MNTPCITKQAEKRISSGVLEHTSTPISYSPYPGSMPPFYHRRPVLLDLIFIDVNQKNALFGVWLVAFIIMPTACNHMVHAILKPPGRETQCTDRPKCWWPCGVGTLFWVRQCRKCTCTTTGGQNGLWFLVPGMERVDHKVYAEPVSGALPGGCPAGRP